MTVSYNHKTEKWEVKGPDPDTPEGEEVQIIVLHTESTERAAREWRDRRSW